MEIGWFRDLVICIAGLVFTAVIILIGILALLLYRRILPILDSAKTASATVKEMTAAVKNEIVAPIVQLAGLIRGVTQGIGLATKLFKREEREGGSNG